MMGPRVVEATKVAILNANYVAKKLQSSFPTLYKGREGFVAHECIIDLRHFKKVTVEDVAKRLMDFGYHAPTVAFPETFGLMIEPTESYTKAELDRFADSVRGIIELVRQDARVLVAAPRFTPIDRVDDVAANRSLILSERLARLPAVIPNRVAPDVLGALPVAEVKSRILATV